jgi:hypothetical protein
MTALILDFYRSGEFCKVEQILIDAGLNEDQVHMSFLLKLKLTGSTKDGGSMECHFVEESPAEFEEFLYSGILTAIGGQGDYDDILEALEMKEERGDKNILTVLKYFSMEWIKKTFWKEIVTHSGYEVTTLIEAIEASDQSISGMLLPTGEFVQCGYQSHMILFPLLKSTGVALGGDSLSSDALSISSSLLTGSMAYCLQTQSYSVEKFMLSNRQVEELWKVREHKLMHYSNNSKNESITAQLLGYNSYKKGLGGKFGNLEFLTKFYPEVALAKYARSPNIDWGTVIVRTSPKNSMPGLLNSIKAQTGEEIDSAVSKIISDFKIHMNVIRNNEINWFFQEFIEGKNGVVNCFERPKWEQPKNLSQEYTDTLKYDIEIACSTVQGDIVIGHTTNYEVSPKNSQYLRQLSRRLAKDFSSDIQLEFVINEENQVKIVQLRLLKNKVSKNFEIRKELLEEALVTGTTFCSPTYYDNIEVDLNDILIVEQDCSSEMLLGKKALIVENTTSFSHILALSKALNIPSIYGTGKVTLGGKSSFRFNTEYETGFVK